MKLNSDTKTALAVAVGLIVLVYAAQKSLKPARI